MIRQQPSSPLFPYTTLFRSKPVGAGSPSHAVWIETIKNGKEKIQADINSADKQSELWPTQAQQPAIDVAPSPGDRKSTRLNSSHRCISYAVFCLKKKNQRLR